MKFLPNLCQIAVFEIGSKLHGPSTKTQQACCIVVGFVQLESKSSEQENQEWCRNFIKSLKFVSIMNFGTVVPICVYVAASHKHRLKSGMKAMNYSVPASLNVTWRQFHFECVLLDRCWNFPWTNSNIYFVAIAPTDLCLQPCTILQ